MRSWGAILLALTAACFSPRPPEDIACTPDGRCPDGQRCIDGTCRGPSWTDSDAAATASDARDRIDGAAATDHDGDGVIDSADNCPDQANPGQHDEDADGRGDICDLCPPFADPSQPDADGDGVGDACDPHVDAATESWVVFAAFDAAAPAGWTLPTGWQVSGDQLHSPPAVTTQSDAVYAAVVANAYVITRLTVTAVDPGAGPVYRSAGAITAVDTGEYRCILRDAIANGASAGISRDTAVLTTDPLAGAALGATATVRFEDDGTGLACSGDTDDGRMWDSSITDAMYGDGKVGVRVQNAVASFDFVAVVQIGP